MFRFFIIFLSFSLMISSCRQNTPIGQRVFYEIFVHAFFDSNGDGIGDLPGVTAKLDYLQELGISGIWLLPVHPSPSYHKYDVTDYYGIHPDYGTMEDMRTLIEEAHKRDILVLIDMVINHTSSEHFFFKEARKGKQNPYRDYYVWSSDTLLQKEEPRHWHKNPGDKEKYYGFFWKGMPDLNFDKPEVREEMKKIGTFWLTEVGVDGFRLDAIKYIYPDSLQGKNVEWWQEYRACLDKNRKDYFMVAEIWDESAFIGPFLNKGVHSAFNFDLSFAIEEMLITGKDPGIARLLNEIRMDYGEASDEYQDALFIKNHDQDRIMSLLADPRQAKLAASILLTLPGIPFLYYGEEIAMLGMKPDEYIREPMVWDFPGKDSGQTRWIKPRYSIADKIVPVSVQEKNPESLLSHYRNMIALRKKHPCLAEGSVKGLTGIPDRFCAYLVKGSSQEILVIHNLSDRVAKTALSQIDANGHILYIDGKLTGKKNMLQLEPYGTLIFKY